MSPRPRQFSKAERAFQAGVIAARRIGGGTSKIQSPYRRAKYDSAFQLGVQRFRAAYARVKAKEQTKGAP